LRGRGWSRFCGARAFVLGLSWWQSLLLTEGSEGEGYEDYEEN